MKLFVWNDVLTDWTSGAVIVLAEDVNAARIAAFKECDYMPPDTLDSEPEVREITDEWAFVIWGGS